MYTVEDLEEAKNELKIWQDRIDRYTGNNPNKYLSDIRAARRRVRMVEDALIAAEVIPLSDTEKLARDLDKKFPEAGNKQVVENDGRRFQRKFWPIEKSLSGKTVIVWGKSWAEITTKE